MHAVALTEGMEVVEDTLYSEAMLNYGHCFTLNIPSTLKQEMAFLEGITAALEPLERM
jgi:hypothetical protein